MIATQSPLLEGFKKIYQDGIGSLFNDNERQKAWELFEKEGMPTKKTEEYKFVPITRLLEKNFEAGVIPATTAVALKNDSLKGQFISDAEGYRIVVVNGQVVEELSAFPQGITISEISKLNDDDLKSHLGKYIQPDEDPFVALNVALSNSGFVFKIAKNQVVDKPIYIYNLTDTTKGDVHLQSRTLVVLEENSQAKVMVVNKGFGDNSAFINEVNEVAMGQNARLEWMRLQDEPEKNYHINNTRVYQEKDAHFHAVSLALSGGLIRNNLGVQLDGQGCESNLYGLYMIGESHVVDNHTVVDHKQANANSNELYKGILFDKAKGVFNGKIYVRPGAQQTNAFQSNKNILLSPDATVNTKPQLEIWADDVKCSHGCTTGQLDEEAVFYLQARGLSKELAKALLLQAFAGEVLEQVKIEEVRTFMKEYVNNKLGV